MPHAGVTDAHRLLHHGVNCSLSTNNVLNPFTPFVTVRSYAWRTSTRTSRRWALRPIRANALNMVTTRSAKLLNLKDYGIAVGA